jgi:AcrR family transcriptional regulator
VTVKRQSLLRFPGVTSLRERKKAKTRHDLMVAALRLYADRGLAETTAEEIAEDAGVSARTFFRYYPTKVDAVFGEHPERLAALRDALGDDSGDVPLAERVFALFLRFAREFERDRELFLVRARLFATEPAVRNHWLELLDTVETRIAEAAAGGRPGPAELHRARLVAALLTSVLRSAAFTWGSSEGKASLTGMLERGFAAVRPALEALRRE